MPFATKLAALTPLVLGLLCCALLARPRPVGRPGLLGAGLLVVSSVLWSRLQGPYEGTTVVVVSLGHGLTVADLVIVPSLGIAAAVAGRFRFRGGRPRNLASATKVADSALSDPRRARRQPPAARR